MSFELMEFLILLTKINGEKTIINFKKSEIAAPPSNENADVEIFIHNGRIGSIKAPIKKAASLHTLYNKSCSKKPAVETIILEKIKKYNFLFMLIETVFFNTYIIFYPITKSTILSTCLLQFLFSHIN